MTRSEDGILNLGQPDTGRLLPNGLGEVFDTIRPRLRLVEQFIADQLAGGPSTVKETGTYVFAGGGKRVRPATLLLVSRMLGYEGSRDVRYGAVVEMIHTATLVHDDIIDHATVRRGRETANNRWGNQLTVLLGDWLYTRSMELALEVGDVEVMRVLSRATIEMIEGEILGLKLKGRIDVTREQYLEITRRKTAELFAAACSIPALFDPSYAAYQEPLAEFGRNLGFCFQIVDDLLDITGTQSTLGKPVFSDLSEGTLTLPFIRLLPHLDERGRRVVERVLTEGRFDDASPDELRSWLEMHDILTEIRQLAVDYGRRAVEGLTVLPPGPERDALESAPLFLIERDR